MIDENAGSASFEQNITVTGGSGYGVIGADIHVFGDGMPVYLLINWQPELQADLEWLRELPSRMLNARFAVVDFTGRDDDMRDLHLWKGEGPRLSARWLHAPGGQGKTRLANKFAAEATAEGWKVVTAIHGPGVVIPPAGSQDLRLDGVAAGVLLIVDYADRWPLSHLTWLFSNALLHQVGMRTRVLLIGRSADMWPALRASLANLQAATATDTEMHLHLLSPLPDQEQRSVMFDTARDSFARTYGLADPSLIEATGPLDDPDEGLTLAVHMAALVAVDAHIHGQRPPQGMAALTIYLLDREHLHWANLYGDPDHELNPQERTYRTTPAVMNQAVFTAALTGPQTRSHATVVLQNLQVDLNPDQVLDDHAICYPPTDPAQPSPAHSPRAPLPRSSRRRLSCPHPARPPRRVPHTTLGTGHHRHRACPRRQWHPTRAPHSYPDFPCRGRGRSMDARLQVPELHLDQRPGPGHRRR
jgi:hypothetical protein